MSPPWRCDHTPDASFPRVSGDEPTRILGNRLGFSFSPRERG